MVQTNENGSYPLSYLYLMVVPTGFEPDIMRMKISYPSQLDEGTILMV